VQWLTLWEPSCSLQVTLLNFGITREGLEDQLLGIVVAQERPELQEEKARLVLAGAENARQLKEIEVREVSMQPIVARCRLTGFASYFHPRMWGICCALHCGIATAAQARAEALLFAAQDNIIAVLSHSEGNILENEDAINVISSSKALSNDIQTKQQVAERTEKKIDEARAGYKPVAQVCEAIESVTHLPRSHMRDTSLCASVPVGACRCRVCCCCCAQVVSVLFFVISELAAVEPMYQYSLAWFVGLFEATLVQAEKARDLHKRIDNLLQHFQYSLYLKASCFGHCFVRLAHPRRIPRLLPLAAS